VLGAGACSSRDRQSRLRRRALGCSRPDETPGRRRRASCRCLLLAWSAESTSPGALGCSLPRRGSSSAPPRELRAATSRIVGDAGLPTLQPPLTRVRPGRLLLVWSAAAPGCVRSGSCGRRRRPDDAPQIPVNGSSRSGHGGPNRVKEGGRSVPHGLAASPREELRAALPPRPGGA
jgi:hypothetical protein